MSIKFENLKSTTSTVLVELDTSLAMPSIFYLLPITFVKQTEKPKGEKKLPPPRIEKPGRITTITYNKNIRGYVRTVGKKWLNSISLDMSTFFEGDFYSIHIKIMSNKITAVGCKSIQNGFDTIEVIISHILRIQRYINYSNKYPLETLISINWILNNIQEGGEKLRTNGKKIPKEIYHMTEFFLNYLIDFSDISTYANFLNFFANDVRELHTSNLKFDKRLTCMINYKFNLVEENQIILRRNIRDIYRKQPKIWASFVPLTSKPTAVITYPYEIPEDEIDMRKSNKDPATTFTITKEGSVTISAVNPKHGEECFNHFMNIFYENYDLFVRNKSC